MGERLYTGKLNNLKLTVISAISLIVLFICPFIGIKNFSLFDVIFKDEYRFIFTQIRIPRTLSSFFAGGGLAIAGMVFQALFRNPLASPYTLGVSGGASLGAALCITFGAGISFFGISVTFFGAVAGAMTSMLMIYGFLLSRESNSTTLVLAGVVISTICSGLIMFLHQVNPLQNAFQIMKWTMGGVDGITFNLLAILLIPIFFYLMIVAVILPQLDQFMTGEDIAYSRGINIRFIRSFLINITALCVGCIVAICGPIGFVGIISPHTCRMIIPGVRHRLLAICSFLIGGTFLTISDTLARILIPPAEIPVGIITAILGGPFFLVVLFRRKSRLMM